MTAETPGGAAVDETPRPSGATTVKRKRRPKDIGTAAETAVVRVLRDDGFPHAERRALRGTLDCGDVTGIPGLVVEVKGGATAQTASDGQIAAWLDETERERVNAGADFGLLVVQRKGIGVANAGRWWAVTDLSSVSALLDHAGYGRGGYPDRAPVRMTLVCALSLLRAAGYGDPLS